MFDLLVRMGYKEIEVGFPSASQTDYDFVRGSSRGTHSRRRDHPGADPVSRPPGAPHLRCDPRVEAGHRPLLQLDVGPPAPRRVRAGPGRHHRHRGPGRPPLPQARGDRPSTPTCTTSTPRSPTPAPSYRLRGPHLQRGHRRHRPDPGPPDDREPAGDGRDGHAQCVRGLDRVHGAQPRPAGVGRRLAAPAQRPRHRCRGGRVPGLPAGADRIEGCPSATASGRGTSAWSRWE